MMRFACVSLVFFFGAASGAEKTPITEGPNGHRLVTIAAGRYELGREGNPINLPHVARLRTYRIADAETTNEQFAAFVKATGYVTDAEKRKMGKTFREGMPDWAWNETEGAHWRRPFGPDGLKAEDAPTHPVTQISGEDAIAYCRWVGGRLPTLDEWEAAARAGAKTLYPWGDEYDRKRANIWNGKSHRAETADDGFVYTSPVRSFPPNAWGLYDVVGNVFEYCADLPEAYREPREHAARIISGRGGSWWCSAGTCHFYNLADIGRMDRHGSLANQGFRVVLDVKAAAPARSKK
jgi:formylglycine-generating enzyme required for sulfatase activity